MRRRPHLLWLLVPFLLYLGAVPFVNRVRPVVGGVPFLVLWLLLATLATPPLVWLAYRGDRKLAATGGVARAGGTGSTGSGSSTGSGGSAGSAGSAREGGEPG